MAKPGLLNIGTTQTFQTWLDTTNEMVDIFKTSALTASVSGDTTEGNATLIGTFNITNAIISSTLRTDTISPKTGSTVTAFTSQIFVRNPSGQTVQTLSSPAGPKTLFSSSPDGISGGIIWEAGFQNTTNNNFIINTGSGATKFSLSTSGNLAIPGTVTSTGGFVGNVTGNLTGNVTGQTSDIANHTATIRSLLSAGTGVVYNSSTGAISIGQEVNTNSTVTFASLTTTGKINANGNLAIRNSAPTIFLRDTNQSSAMLQTNDGKFYVQRGGTDTETTTQVNGVWPLEINLNNNDSSFGGNIFAVGDITAFSSSSDIRRKENIKVIPNALEKVSQIGGYTFNFIGDDRKLTGVIAQEMEQILPEVVYEITDKDTGETSKAVRYGNIVGLLIEAIKELKKEVDILKNGN